MLSSNRWFIASAILLPAALLALAGWLNYRQIHAETVRSVEQTTTALSEHALRTLRAHELIIDFVDRHVEGWSWQRIVSSEDLHRMLVRLRGEGPDVSSIFLLDPQGKAWVSSRAFPMPAIDASDRDYFHALRGGERLVISAPSRGRLTGDRFFSLARSRIVNGRFDGVIAVSVNPEYFERFYATVVPSAADAAALIRADGLVMVRHPSAGDAPMRLPADGPFMQALREDPVAGSYIARAFADGTQRIFAYRRVADFPLYASFSLSTRAIWGAWRRAMIPYALACLLAGAMLLVGASLAEQRTRRAAAEARGREAEESSRAKDRFVAALSHELRNPLAAISLATEVLERSPPRGDGEEGPLGVIRRQVHQLRRMLDDLLDTSRALYGKLSLEKRRVEVRAVAQAVVSDQQARAADGVLISLEGEEAWVDADPVRLAQMIENLVENAVKYGGRRIRVAIEADTQAARVSVADDGQGIAPELLPRLFQPFVQGEQTLDRAQGGLGLGLALVDRLAALHGGSLSAQSEGAGRGATFVLRLPVATAGMADAAPAIPPELRRQRFLVVEDEADARERLEQLLRLEGHEVVVAASGAEGVAAARAIAPDVALLDIGLPGMDGYELARRLRALAGGEALVLVAVTGYGQREDRGNALAAGFDAHLTKPYTYQDLMRTLSGVLRKRSGPLPPAQQAA